MKAGTEKFCQVPKAMAKRRDLTATAKMVYAVIRDRLGKNDCAWPGVRRIAADAGVSVQTVIHAVEQLEARGLMRVVRQGNGRVNKYYFPAMSSRGAVVSDKPKRSRSRKGGAQETVSEAINGPGHNETNNETSVNETKTDKDTLEKLKAYFLTEWSAKYGKDYPYEGRNGRQFLERVLESSGSLGEAQEVIDAYFREKGDFYSGHPLKKLADSLPRFVAAAGKAPRTLPYSRRDEPLPIL